MLQGSTAMDLGRTPISVRGFGATATPTDCEQYGSNPPPGCPGNTSGSGSGSKFNWANAGNSLVSLLNKYTSSTPPAGGTPNPNLPPAPAPQGNRTLKIVGIVAGVAAVTGLTIWAVRSSGKKKKA